MNKSRHSCRRRLHLASSTHKTPPNKVHWHVKFTLRHHHGRKQKHREHDDGAPSPCHLHHSSCLCLAFGGFHLHNNKQQQQAHGLFTTWRTLYSRGRVVCRSSWRLVVVCRMARHGGHGRWIERCARGNGAGTASGRTIRCMFNNIIMLKRGSFLSVALHEKQGREIDIYDVEYHGRHEIRRCAMLWFMFTYIVRCNV